MGTGDVKSTEKYSSTFFLLRSLGGSTLASIVALGSVATYRVCYLPHSLHILVVPVGCSAA